MGRIKFGLEKRCQSCFPPRSKVATYGIRKIRQNPINQEGVQRERAQSEV